ncbi:SgcJ/EcaC family oxidoreductase [Kaistella polysaccharea]|uniref:SgcJ/EcaC family oxidoreductase n=1 Tax=Kaistella polysaccharea TaxID=2878534 RepID=UPI001CF44CD2|nr:SgcJ/EcaC family oxidoreductase [Kaistella polysaccharea]
MKKILLLFLALISYSGINGQASDDSLKQIIQKQEADWNKNDMKAFSEAFSDDATLINFLGMYWKGKENISAKFSQINDCCIKPTSVKYELIDTKLINESSAVAHIKEELTAKSDYTIPGGIVKKGNIDQKYITAVFQKADKIWKIISMQVTQISLLAKP